MLMFQEVPLCGSLSGETAILCFRGRLSYAGDHKGSISVKYRKKGREKTSEEGKYACENRTRATHNTRRPHSPLSVPHTGYEGDASVPTHPCTTPAPTGIREVFGGWVTRAITGNFRGRTETLSVTNVNV